MEQFPTPNLRKCSPTIPIHLNFFSESVLTENKCSEIEIVNQDQKNIFLSVRSLFYNQQILCLSRCIFKKHFFLCFTPCAMCITVLDKILNYREKHLLCINIVVFANLQILILRLKKRLTEPKC